METFEKYIEKGILSKAAFDNSANATGFIDWLKPFISGQVELSKIGFTHESIKNFESLVNKYNWEKGDQKESFGKTYERFCTERSHFSSLTENDKLAERCIEILKWGGVLPHNKQKIENRKNLSFFLKNIRQVLLQTEIFIEDLNPNHINSGYTKIYAALDERFIIYDSRVGAALGMLVRKFLEEKQMVIIPTELNFGWCIGRGKKLRNPSSSKYKFPNIIQSREQHFISNIMANWLLEKLVEDKSISICGITEQPKVIFAIQTALFMLGEDLKMFK